MQPSSPAVPPHYECLGVAPSISAADLARHYKKLSLELHPDRAAYRNDAGNEVHVQARYQRITEAYAVLSDPEKRSAYDTRHGVNFQSRVVRLQAAIGQHNTSALQRTTSSASPVLLQGDTTNARSDHAEPNEADGDEDDDEYDPNEVAVTSRGATAQPSAHPPRAAPARRKAAGAHDSDESDGDDVTQLFSLQPRHGDAAGATHTVEGVPVTQLRGLTLRRPRTFAAAAAAVTPYFTRTWGLLFDQNVLVGLDDEYPETLHDIAGLAGAPFPSVVQQVNDTMVLPRADVGRLVSQASGAPSGGEPNEIAAPSSEAPEMEELHLTLAYTTCCFDLVGDVHLLRDATTVERLVPAWCIAPQLGPLASDAVVLSVNGAAVRSGAELRAALRGAAAASADSPEADAQTLKRPRTSPAIAVELCQLPFM